MRYLACEALFSIKFFTFLTNFIKIDKAKPQVEPIYMYKFLPDGKNISVVNKKTEKEGAIWA